MSPRDTSQEYDVQCRCCKTLEHVWFDPRGRMETARKFELREAHALLGSGVAISYWVIVHKPCGDEGVCRLFAGRSRVSYY